MDVKLSVNAVFFGRRRDRFTEYQPHRDLPEKLDLIAKVPGVTGVELKHPADTGDIKLVRSLLEKHGLQLSAINVDMKDAAWFRHGAFSNARDRSRGKAIAMVREAMDIAVELGTDIVSTCPLFDGYDYPFQLDYNAAWDRMVDSLRQCTVYRRDVSLVLEYQAYEPHSHTLVRNVGTLLHVCNQVGEPNLGANLDVGHALAAHDSPAEAACLLHRHGLLRYIHYNDNTGEGGDWDMISGSVHYWHWVELLYTLARLGYDGWLSGDIASKHTDPLTAYRTNTLMLRSMCRLLDRVGIAHIHELVRTDGGFARVMQELAAAVAPAPEAEHD